MAVKASASITLSSVVDVKSVWRYYKLQSSTLSKPAKPTTNPPSGWTTTEPSYTSGSTNSLYLCDLTVFSDDTFTYSDVSLSSSYEAAKAAWNKAQGVQDSVDNMEIGGRNLILNSNTVNSNWVNNGSCASIEQVVEDGFDCIKLTNSSTTSTAIPSITNSKPALVLDWGSTYTLSVWLKFPVDVPVFATKITPAHYHFYANANRPTGPSIAISGSGAAYPGAVTLVEGAGGFKANVWKKIVLRFTTLATAPTGYPYACFRPYIFGNAGVNVPTLFMRGYKFEKGNKATDWTPAPEDVKADVDNAQSTADNANTSAGNAIKNIQHLNTELTKHESAVESRFTSMVEYVDGKTQVVDTWIRSGSDGTTPFCELGQSNSDFKTRLTNTELGFYEQTDKIAYFGNKQMHVTDADIDTANADKLTIGGYTFVANSDGHLTLIYTG